MIKSNMEKVLKKINPAPFFCGVLNPRRKRYNRIHAASCGVLKRCWIKFKSQKGVTVVELLLYMSILAILLTILTSVFVSALDVQSESQASSSVEQDGNYILARLSYDIHRAQSINIPAINGATDNNFQIVVNGVSYTYSVDASSNLILTNDLGVNNLNNYGSSVSAFLVQRLGNTGEVENTLKINFTATSRTKRISGYEVRDFQTNLSLRRQ